MLKSSTLKSFTRGGSLLSEKEITTVICIDNKKQWGANFEAFVEMINRESVSECHESFLESIIIIDSSYLHRHYDAKYSDPKHSEWQEKNLEIIKKLKIKVTYKTWHDLISVNNFSDFNEWHKKIKNDYETNKDGFAAIIDKLASEFASKNGSDSAINYLLEECAALPMKKGKIAFPGGLNLALKWVVKTYKLPISILTYSIEPAKIKEIPVQNQSKTDVAVKNDSVEKIGYTPSFFGQTLAYYADQLNLPPEKHTKFTLEYLKFCERFSDSSSEKSSSDSDRSIENNEVNIIQLRK